MTDFEDFNLVLDTLVQYFTGSYAFLGIAFIAVFFLIMVARGLDIRYASVFTLPFVGFFVAVGWFGPFGETQWIVNLLLLIVGLFYGFAIVKIMT